MQSLSTRGIDLLHEYVHNYHLDLVALCRPLDPSFDNALDVSAFIQALREQTLPFRPSDLDDITRLVPLTPLHKVRYLDLYQSIQVPSLYDPQKSPKPQTLYAIDNLYDQQNINTQHSKKGLLKEPFDSKSKDQFIHPHLKQIQTQFLYDDKPTPGLTQQHYRHNQSTRHQIRTFHKRNNEICLQNFQRDVARRMDLYLGKKVRPDKQSQLDHDLVLLYPASADSLLSDSLFKDQLLINSHFPFELQSTPLSLAQIKLILDNLAIEWPLHSPDLATLFHCITQHAKEPPNLNHVIHWANTFKHLPLQPLYEMDMSRLENINNSPPPSIPTMHIALIKIYKSFGKRHLLEVFQGYYQPCSQVVAIQDLWVCLKQLQVHGTIQEKRCFQEYLIHHLVVSVLPGRYSPDGYSPQKDRQHRLEQVQRVNSIQQNCLFFSLEKYIVLMEDTMMTLNIPVPQQAELPSCQSASASVLQSLLSKEVQRLHNKLLSMADNLGLLHMTRIRTIMEEDYQANRQAVDSLLQACSYQGNNQVLLQDFIFQLKTHYSSLFIAQETIEIPQKIEKVNTKYEPVLPPVPSSAPCFHQESVSLLLSSLRRHLSYQLTRPENIAQLDTTLNEFLYLQYLCKEKDPFDSGLILVQDLEQVLTSSLVLSLGVQDADRASQRQLQNKEQEEQLDLLNGAHIAYISSLAFQMAGVSPRRPAPADSPFVTQSFVASRPREQHSDSAQNAVYYMLFISRLEHVGLVGVVGSVVS